MSVCSVTGCNRAKLALGLCSMHWQRQRRNGTLGLVRREKGTFTVRPDGRVLISVNGEQRREHIVIAERALGHKLPLGAEIHHVDEDPGNNSPENLVICPNHRYHMLLHVRQKAFKHCGDASWRQCGYCKKYDAIVNLSRHGSRETFYHKQCAANYQKRRSSNVA